MTHTTLAHILWQYWSGEDNLLAYMHWYGYRSSDGSHYNACVLMQYWSGEGMLLACALVWLLE